MRFAAPAAHRHGPQTAEKIGDEHVALGRGRDRHVGAFADGDVRRDRRRRRGGGLFGGRLPRAQELPPAEDEGDRGGRQQGGGTPSRSCVCHS